MDAWQLGLDGDGDNGELDRAAVLAYQLPRTSRTYRALNPMLENGTAEHLLRRIEHNQRMWAWSHSEDAKNRVNVPEPMTLPGEDERHEELTRREERNAADVAALMGLNI